MVSETMKFFDETDYDTLYQRTEAYRAKLRATMAGRIAKGKRLSFREGEINYWLDETQTDLIALGELYLPKAVRLGYGARQINQKFSQVAQEQIDRNSGFIMSNYMPRLRNISLLGHKQEDEEDIGGYLDEYEAELLAVIELYAGAYWLAIWIGMGLSYTEIAEMLGISMKVERILDSRARHCDTCPPKARVYSSWAAMLQYCGGLPGDGSDQCMSRCRCSLRIYVG